jgi:hypothetical protein
MDNISVPEKNRNPWHLSVDSKSRWIDRDLFPIGDMYRMKFGAWLLSLPQVK